MRSPVTFADMVILPEWEFWTASAEGLKHQQTALLSTTFSSSLSNRHALSEVCGGRPIPSLKILFWGKATQGHFINGCFHFLLPASQKSWKSNVEGW